LNIDIESGMIAAAMIGTLAFFIRKWIAGLEAQIQTLATALSAKVSDAQCRERQSGVSADINKICAEKERSHERLWDHLHHHRHAESGEFVLTTKD
jgi:hypothetical protein